MDDAALYDFALSYVLSNPAVSTVIPGVSHPGQLGRALSSAEAPRLAASELDRIRAVVARHVSSLGQAFQLN
ncbi:MAG: aldo/keto reductase [Elusimicrobia bacterium]|nr:aldo/keto reductase [Elusimicrobiota bacterium]